MPLTRGRSVRFDGYLHRDSIGAAPSGAAPNFSGVLPRDRGALGVADGNRQRPDQPDVHEEERRVGRECRGQPATPPKPPDAPVSTAARPTANAMYLTRSGRKIEANP